MAERGIEAIRAKLATLPPSTDVSVEALRTQYDKAVRVFPVGPDTRVEDVAIGGVACERLTPAGAATGDCLIYLHGGGYAIGSPRSHRHVAAEIARLAGTVAVVPDYRLCPEHRHPAAVEDALAVYRGLLDGGIAANRIVIAGDSAGGGLTIACALAARDAGLPMPAALVCLSPWTDMEGSGESHVTRAARDPMVRAADLARWRSAYMGDADPRAPLASPIHADLRGLPPMLIQVGDEEVLLDDARLFAERARAAGVEAKLEVWDRMIHVWHWYWPMLDEGAQAIATIAAFMRGLIGAAR